MLNSVTPKCVDKCLQFSKLRLSISFTSTKILINYMLDLNWKYLHLYLQKSYLNVGLLITIHVCSVMKLKQIYTYL